MDELEAIRQLKARYCRLLDAKDWAAWRELFTDDFVSDTRESGGTLIAGADEFIAFVRKTLGAPGRVTVHQVHAPEIEQVSASTARGIWALEDYVKLAFALSMHGYGHYHETYEKADGCWRIKSSKLTRLRVDIATPLFSVDITRRLRKAAAAGRT
jgi:SnoaL-like protein